MTRTRRAGTVAALLLTSAALSACGAGQVTQTATQDRDRTGGHSRIGDITIRAVQLAYPADGVHDPGDPVELTMAIVNSGRDADELIGVIGDPFTGATVGAAGKSAGVEETPADVSEAPPPQQSAVSIPLPADETVHVGQPDDLLLLTGLTEPLGSAHSVPLRLVFARAGEVTVLAITEPAPARPRSPGFDFHVPE
ncbi:hypothetical protein [Blastococcus sp. PRF04-17]|uniref:hypothetical protein n=1 Tax=Blastococcus sp. PRF04-17 TaxID=2933797 RepID=UPI001FF29E50|nr:hypothetical protein [Blastococcus sp. PRF04-17]UOX99966.1 hypothetical protein MVA48_13105 [Blastococcus sp. PRF04-17]